VKLLVDMNLSPAWVETLAQMGWTAVHWSTLGNPRSTDAEIMRFAHDHDWVVFTHDLDFGALLAHTRAGKPSVFQVRSRDVSPTHLASLVDRVLRQFSPQLESGALVSVDEASQRVRLLPLTR
jgi:predicted nuclease of predicted toxin-antitoxin system